MSQVSRSLEWGHSQSTILGKSYKVHIFFISLLAFSLVLFSHECGVSGDHKRTDGFLRGKMRPMHFSGYHRSFWNMGGPFGQSWKPPGSLAPHIRPIASTLAMSDRAGSSRVPEERGTFVPFIGARALSNLPKFFEHLRENMEIMRDEERLSPDYPQDEPSDELGREKGSHSMEATDIQEPKAMAMTAGPQEWMWPAAVFFRGKNLVRAS